ncbi:SAGA-associated factor 29-like [Styela clava]|uniref:SAGA-associated factor 29-like n=1 Tax=Styela clava TaxID=7725 RepID=UPI0019399CE2|nr:SAGA-associated factor 29-like [Styela clava]
MSASSASSSSMMAGPMPLQQGIINANQARFAGNDEKIQELLRELHTTIFDTQKERENGFHSLDNIAKTHDKIQSEQKLTTYYRQKLRNLYSTALADAGNECDLLRKGLAIITQIKTLQEEKRMAARISGMHPHDDQPRKTMRRGVLMSMLQKSAQTLPLWIGKPDEKPPPLCGAIPSSVDYIAKPGDKVAARVRTEEGEEQWILAEVISFNPTSNKYEVDDIDEEGKERHTLSKRRVVPLPQWRANPDTDPDAIYSKGTLVMALYPQTTCFYRSVIHVQPKTSQDEYLVLFEDNSYADGYSPALPVAQKYVVVPKELRESKRR